MPHDSKNTRTIIAPLVVAASDKSTSAISKTAVPPLQRAPAQAGADDGMVQMYSAHATAVHPFSMPDGIKPAANGETAVKPFQLRANNRDVATDAAPEAWHVVLQQQGRVQPAFQLKEVLHEHASEKNEHASEKPVQRVVKYEIDPTTRKFFNVKYIRGNQPLALIGKMHGKHTTADVAQAAVYELGLEGRTLDDGLFYLTEVTKAYLNMPGNYLIDFHMNQTGNIWYNYRNEGIPQAFETYFDLSKKLFQYAMISGNLVRQYREGDETEKQRLAFEMFAMVNNITYNLGEFREVVPLVSLYSKGEKGGKEKEAKASLYESERLLRDGGTIDEETKAQLKLELMDHFDLAAVKMIYDTSEDKDKEASFENNLREALNWLDIDVLATKLVDMDSGKTTDERKYEKIAGQIVSDMVQNHILQMYVSYPNVARAVNFQDFNIKDMTALMEKKKLPAIGEEVGRIFEEGNVDMWVEDEDEGEVEGKGKERLYGKDTHDDEVGGENAVDEETGTENAVDEEADSDDELYDEDEFEFNEETDGVDAMNEEIRDLNQEITTDGFLPSSTKEDRKKTTFNFSGL